jgi:hypothetical protein
MLTIATLQDSMTKSVESRRQARARSFLGGKLVSRDGHISARCLIRDISASGARISISNDIIIASPLFLIASSNQTIYVAKIVWRNASQAGLEFIDRHSMGNVEIIAKRYSQAV